MRPIHLLALLLPAMAFAQGSDLLFSAKAGDEVLFELSIEGEDVEYLMSDDFDCESLSLLADSLKGEEESSIPWAIDSLAKQDIATLVEEQIPLEAVQGGPSSYEETLRGEAVSYGPTLENVPQSNRSFFSRPKVVESRPAKSEKKNKSEKTHRSKILTNRVP